MWRWWTPVLIAFEDPKAIAAQERLSNGIFRQPHMKQGFTARMTDVEHSNEDTTDSILPLMHLRPDDPLWKGRALQLAELMRERWTGRNERGFLQFKSIYFSVDKVNDDPGLAFDSVYHVPCAETRKPFAPTGRPTPRRCAGPIGSYRSLTIIFNTCLSPRRRRLLRRFFTARQPAILATRSVLPLNAVRWLTPPREIAALVTESGPQRFEAELFHFGKERRKMAAEFYLLKPGTYIVSLKNATKQDEIVRQSVTVRDKRATVAFNLPPGKLCKLRVRPE